MITKICNRCSQEFPADSGFYPNDNSCKECRKYKVKAARRRNSEYYKEYDRARANRPDRIRAREEYKKTDRGKQAISRANRRWIERNKKKRWVTHAVNNAVRDGRLVKPLACENCGSTAHRIHGHHDDYDRPLEVCWLCPACHNDWHKRNGEGANAQ